MFEAAPAVAEISEAAVALAADISAERLRNVEMIEKYYAAHIKDRLDAGAINVRKRKKRAKPATR